MAADRHGVLDLVFFFHAHLRHSSKHAGGDGTAGNSVLKHTSANQTIGQLQCLINRRCSYLLVRGRNSSASSYARIKLALASANQM
jgi:hypothetical protein